MNQQTIASLLDTHDTKFVGAGTTIFYQGEVPRGVFIVKKGVVKEYSISKNGEERIVDFIVEGELLAGSWVSGTTTSTIYFYQALTDCELYVVPKQTYVDYLQNAPVMAESLALLNRRYTASLIRITALEQSRARDKLLFTFYYLIKRFGKEIAPEWSTIQIALTHQMIADLVGLTRETTAIELNTIKKLKIISYKHQKYMVQEKRLLKAIDEDSFASIVL